MNLDKFLLDYLNPKSNTKMTQKNTIHNIQYTPVKQEVNLSENMKTATLVPELSFENIDMGVYQLLEKAVAITKKVEKKIKPLKPNAVMFKYMLKRDELFKRRLASQKHSMLRDIEESYDIKVDTQKKDKDGNVVKKSLFPTGILSRVEKVKELLTQQRHEMMVYKSNILQHSISKGNDSLRRILEYQRKSLETQTSALAIAKGTYETIKQIATSSYAQRNQIINNTGLSDFARMTLSEMFFTQIMPGMMESGMIGKSFRWTGNIIKKAYRKSKSKIFGSVFIDPFAAAEKERSDKAGRVLEGDEIDTSGDKMTSSFKEGLLSKFNLIKISNTHLESIDKNIGIMSTINMLTASRKGLAFAAGGVKGMYNKMTGFKPKNPEKPWRASQSPEDTQSNTVDNKVNAVFKPAMAINTGLEHGKQMTDVLKSKFQGTEKKIKKTGFFTAVKNVVTEGPSTEQTAVMKDMLGTAVNETKKGIDKTKKAYSDIKKSDDRIDEIKKQTSLDKTLETSKEILDKLNVFAKDVVQDAKDKGKKDKGKKDNKDKAKDNANTAKKKADDKKDKEYRDNLTKKRNEKIKKYTNVDGAKDKIKDTSKTTDNDAGSFLTKLLTSIGVTLPMFFGGGILKMVKSLGGGIIKTAGRGILGLAKKIVFAPITMAATAIGAALTKLGKSTANTANAVYQKIRELFIKVKNFIVNTVSSLAKKTMNALKKAGKNILDFGSKAWTRITGGAKNILDKSNNAIKTGFQWATDMSTTIQKKISSFVKGLKPKRIINLIMIPIKQLKSKIPKGIVKSVIKRLSIRTAGYFLTGFVGAALLTYDAAMIAKYHFKDGMGLSAAASLAVLGVDLTKGNVPESLTQPLSKEDFPENIEPSDIDDVTINNLNDQLLKEIGDDKPNTKDTDKPLKIKGKTPQLKQKANAKDTDYTSTMVDTLTKQTDVKVEKQIITPEVVVNTPDNRDVIDKQLELQKKSYDMEVNTAELNKMTVEQLMETNQTLKDLKTILAKNNAITTGTNINTQMLSESVVPIDNAF